MATVIAAFSMSLDGFVALPDDSVGPLFDWYGNGPVRVEWPGNDMVSYVTPASARYLDELVSATGAVIAGRRIFDHTGGWNGSHPLGVPIFVVTHSIPEGWPRDDAPATFVTEGVEQAVALASEVAGDRIVGVAGPDVARQCLDLGLLDEIRIELVPVLLGQGVPFFDRAAHPPVMFDNPEVIEGDRVTHLRYRLRR